LFPRGTVTKPSVGQTRTHYIALDARLEHIDSRAEVRPLKILGHAHPLFRDAQQLFT
jgi:hypothetical protein